MGTSKRYSPSFERDYSFYLANIDRFDFSGSPPPKVLSSEFGNSAKHCFFVKDSTGVDIECNEPELLQKLLVCKASINLHVSIWAQSLSLGTTTLDEIRSDLGTAPKWVEDAIIKQAYKRGWLSDRYEQEQVEVFHGYSKKK